MVQDPQHYSHPSCLLKTVNILLTWSSFLRGFFEAALKEPPGRETRLRGQREKEREEGKDRGRKRKRKSGWGLKTCHYYCALSSNNLKFPHCSLTLVCTSLNISKNKSIFAYLLDSFSDFFLNIHWLPPPLSYSFSVLNYFCMTSKFLSLIMQMLFIPFYFINFIFVFIFILPSLSCNFNLFSSVYPSVFSFMVSIFSVMKLYPYAQSKLNIYLNIFVPHNYILMGLLII